MRHPRRIAVAAVLLLVGCEPQAFPSAPESATDRADDFVVGIQAAPGAFSFAPPLAPLVVNGPFDAGLAPRIEICSDMSSPCNSVFASFTTQTSPAVQLFPNEQLYGVRWNTAALAPTPGVIYRIRALVGPLELGAVDVAFQTTGNGSGGGIVPNVTTLPAGGVVPLLFRVEDGALPAAQGCLIDPSVLDCDVIQVPVGQGGVVQVGNPTTQEFAGEVAIAANDAVVPNGDPHFVLSLEHIAPPPGLQLSTPWVPFFVRATARDADGNAVTFLSGADMVLCQPETLEDPQSPIFLPHALHQYLQIVRVSGGQAFPLVTTPGAPQCAGPGSAPSTRSGPLSVAARVSRGVARLAGLFRPEPLRALHGGLNTRGIGGFSDFGSTLPVDAAASSATVPAGTSGQTTVIHLQTAVAPGVAHPTGGGVVAGSVTGTNAGAPVTVVDHQDGTYTLSYTPALPGADAVAITIDGVPIGGSPYRSGVSPSGWGSPVIDGVRAAGEWDQAQQLPIFAGPWAGSTLWMLNDAGTLYLGVEVVDGSPSDFDVVRVRFDNDGNGVTDLGDDDLRLDPRRFRDGHFERFWGRIDGQQDGTGAVGSAGGRTFYEMAHPLASGDAEDAAWSAGSMVPLCVLFLEFEQTSAERQFPAGCAADPLDQSGFVRLGVAAPPA
ncbi:MAG: hypothetical protein KC645_09045 [Gemmatimonadetes bacterium]|nr:hypothetical protein [Gemmatimonadota bacterium]